MMNSTSAELRDWASRCEAIAAVAGNENERAVLLRKREALLALADSEDWLAGQLSAAGSGASRHEAAE